MYTIQHDTNAVDLPEQHHYYMCILCRFILNKGRQRHTRAGMWQSAGDAVQFYIQLHLKQHGSVA